MVPVKRLGFSEIFMARMFAETMHAPESTIDAPKQPTRQASEMHSFAYQMY